MTSDDEPRCPYCDSKYWTARVGTRVTWFTCVFCGCIWSKANETEATR